MPSQTSATPAPLSSNQFTRPGYTFANWNTLTDGTGTPYADGVVYSFAADLTLYAQWTLNTYTITYNANGAVYGFVPVPQSGPAGTNVTISQNVGGLEKPGSCFLGWCSSPIGTGSIYAPNSVITLHNNLTLYVLWGCSQTSCQTFNTGFFGKVRM